MIIFINKNANMTQTKNNGLTLKQGAKSGMTATWHFQALTF